MRVAYLLLHFPFLTETFVAEEVKAVRDLGVDVEIVSLLEADPRPAQQLSQALLPYCWYAPGLASPQLWWAQCYFLLTRVAPIWPCSGACCAVPIKAIR